MDEEAFDAVVSRIYDAAVEVVSWDEALVAVARLLRSSQCALQAYNAHGFGIGSAPLMDPDYLAAYRTHWRDVCPVREASVRQAPGRIYDFDALVDRDAFRRTEIYHEWWRAQGLGFGGLGINLVADGPNLAVASIYKPYGQEHSPAERRAFGQLMRHAMRATRINRRLRLAALTHAGPASPSGSSPVVIVDRRGAILLGDDGQCERLRSAGLLERTRSGYRLWSRSGALERMIEGAAKRRGGGCRLPGPDGSELEIEIIPVPEQGGGDFPWLAIDRPAALLHIAEPGGADAARKARLVADHGLTPAEAAVAIEVAKGDGRSAAATRLGLRASTVRTHLMAIFDKLGVHRQAELARLVAAA